MRESSDSKKTPVSLEQLLHVKRAERPAPAFWDEFDREFRRRQLAVVVTSVPWHARLGRTMLGTLRRATPVGAAAAAVLAGFLAINREQKPQPTLPPVQLAQVEPEISHAIAVPEESVSPEVTVAVQDEPTISPMAAFQTGETRYAMQELVSVVKPTRFINITSPHMLSAGGHAEVYRVNALTTGAALHASAQPAAGNF
jgi:hypothetical protein